MRLSTYRQRRVRIARHLALLGVLLLLVSAAHPAAMPLPIATAAPSATPFVLAWSSLESLFTTSTAWGDYDGDGDLDLVVGNYAQGNQLYRNDHGALTLVWQTQKGAQTDLPNRTCNSAATPNAFDQTMSVAWGDYDGDGDLDLAVGNGTSLTAPGGEQHSCIYRNDGVDPQTSQPIFTVSWTAPEVSATTSVAWGDYDGDGRLDLAVGNGQIYSIDTNANTVMQFLQQPNQLYHNDGVDPVTHQPVFTLRWTAPVSDTTTSVAWGDYDGDGRLDLAVGNLGVSLPLPEYAANSAPDRIYHNDGSDPNGTPHLQLAWEAPALEITFSVAWGDVDGDGKLDLAVGNTSAAAGAVELPQQNHLYRFQAGSFQLDQSWQPAPDSTFSLAWGDYDNDGDLDLAVGNATPPGTTTIGRASVIYQNNQGSLSTQPDWTSPLRDDTYSVAWGDVDGDGDLDLLTGSGGPLLSSEAPGQPNRIYRNESGSLELQAQLISLPPPADASPTAQTRAVAWGDVDSDGDLDLVVGQRGLPNQLYRNINGTLTLDTAWNPALTTTTALAWGDVDGDGDLDLIVGNFDAPNQLYRNTNGTLTSTPDWIAPANSTNAVAWGDLDGDGDLDLAVGNQLGPNQLYRNKQGALVLDPTLHPEQSNTTSLAWGDLDGDGDLDLVVGNRDAPTQLYRNQAGQLVLDTTWSPPANRTTSLAWGDVDGDGDLDLALGNFGKPNWLFRNDQGKLTNTPVWSSTEADLTDAIAFGDIDNDGDLDLVVGNSGFRSQDRSSGQANRLYRNDGGTLSPAAVWSSAETAATHGMAWGDVDGDGDLDLVVADDLQQVHLYRNRRATQRSSAPPTIRIDQPEANPPIAAAALYATAHIFATRAITIGYTLFQPDAVPAQRVIGEYSLDGGDHWRSAASLNASPPPNLETSPTGVHHQFIWDVWQSGVIGQSDNVVFRLRVVPDRHARAHHAAEPYQYAANSAVTLPFRVRGSQVQVLAGNLPVSGAVVYHLLAGQASGATPYADFAHHPFYTDAQGFLQGRGEIGLGDRLIAALPISDTETATWYAISAAPTPQGLDAAPVSSFGVQILKVSPDHPLIALKLSVALEWDARSDSAFLSQLQFDLRRASEILFDWTDGQVVLGAIDIFQNREHWDTANIRIYATSRLRPNANQGGIVTVPITDPVARAPGDPNAAPNTYVPGQIRMGAVWNRYGESSSNLGEDWPRTLAHELGHYALFLNDNYLGINSHGQLISLPEQSNGPRCPGAMTNPYTEENSEFHPTAGWQQDCAQTLSNHTTSRSDWATIKTFYDQPSYALALHEPVVYNQNPGPSTLPLDITQFHMATPESSAILPLLAPIFTLTRNNAAYQPGSSARAFLFQDDRLIDLGSPSLNQVIARGARPGDRLCVYEPARSLLGCKEQIGARDDRIELVDALNWQPQLRITPVTSHTLDISVDTTTPFSLTARLYAATTPFSAAIPLIGTAGHYTATLQVTEPVLEGYIQIRATNTATLEAVTDFAIGGNPGLKWSRDTPRGSPGLKWSRDVPTTSSDGQAILFTNGVSFAEGQFVLLQAATHPLAPPPGRAFVGSAYWLTTSPAAPNLSKASINISYLSRDIPDGGERGIRIYYWDGKPGDAWTPLETTLDQVRNEASALLSGPGVYALLSGIAIPLTGPGWNLIAYSSPISQSLPAALQSIGSSYKIVYGYEPTDSLNPWRVYSPDAPTWVNDLTALEPGHGYWLYATESVTLYLDYEPPLPRVAVQSQTTLPDPPAAFYGYVSASPEAAETAGVPITARIGNVVCAQTKSRIIQQRAVFTLKVPADDRGAAGCGQLGDIVTFDVGSRRRQTTWDNRRVQLVAADLRQVFLAIVRR